MGGKRSFLDELSPHRPKSRAIAWPLDPDGGKKVVVRMLGTNEIEQAYFATRDHFDALPKDAKGKKRQVDAADPAFVKRESVELVWRAFRTVEGEPLTPSADDLAEEPDEVVRELHYAWSRFQAEGSAKPVNRETVRELVDDLKKGSPAGPLIVLPSTWLIEVITTLVGPSSSSTTEKGSGL